MTNTDILGIRDTVVTPDQRWRLYFIATKSGYTYTLRLVVAHSTCGLPRCEIGYDVELKRDNSLEQVQHSLEGIREPVKDLLLPMLVATILLNQRWICDVLEVTAEHMPGVWDLHKRALLEREPVSRG